MITWLRQNKFRSHTLSFLLMILASVGMYLAIGAGSTPLIWSLLGIFVLGNLAAMMVK